MGTRDPGVRTAARPDAGSEQRPTNAPRDWERPPLDALTRPITRRRFLWTAGAGGATLFVSERLQTAFGATGPGPGQSVLNESELTLEFSVRRREDFLSLKMQCFNLVLDASDPAAPVLVRKQAKKAAYLVAVLPPQAIADEAFDEPGAAPQEPGAVRVRLAGESRIAFFVPEGTAIPYTVAGVLDWVSLFQNVVEAALVDPFLRRTKFQVKAKQLLRAPKDWETQIELPWRLLLSPNETAGWAHAPGVVTHDGRTELWHTRLGVQKPGKVDEADPTDRTLRAIWSLDPKFAQTIKTHVDPPKLLPPNDDPFAMSLSARDRYEIVVATSDYVLFKKPQPAEVSRLMLSSLGAWIDSRLDLDLPSNAPIDLRSWRQRGTMGRDHYVRIVDHGYLFPFGQMANQITILERKVQDSPSGKRVAYLRRRTFLVVGKPTRTYGSKAVAMPDGGRGFPFTSLEIRTLVTPDLETTQFGSVAGSFVPKVDGTPFPFHMIGTDWAGRETEFTAPVVFVLGTKAFEPASVQSLADAYATAGDSVRSGLFAGQSVAIADSVKAGDTSVEMKRMRFGAYASVDPAAIPKLQAADEPAFYPKLANAEVRLGAAEQASGTELTPPPTIELESQYVSAGFGPGGVFAAIIGTAPPLNFPTDKSGGVVTPNLAITGLSRKLGPVAGTLSQVRDGSWDPKEVFGTGAKLLGGVTLADLIELVTLAGADTPAPAEALKITYSTVGTTLDTHVSWKPQLKSNDVFDATKVNGGASLSLDADIVTDAADPTKSTITIVGDLRNFALNLIGSSGPTYIMRLEFNRLRFTSVQGQKAKVDVDIAKVGFEGVLKFVEKLQELLQLGGDGKGPGVDIEPTGITAKFSIPIPSMSVGVFAISNLAFSAGMTIPFSGDPVRARFALSEREDPFLISVMAFTGGGFVGLALGADGIEKLEASFEFGASISIDLGVASGGVHLMGGIYFSYGSDPDAGGAETTILTGYVRLGGELEVLAIISLSLEFYLSLTYKNVGGHDKVSGQATLSVEVHVLVFSASVSVTAEKHFGNAPGDPTFQDVTTAADWNAYCDAFAAA
jgi:hypothetical protein